MRRRPTAFAPVADHPVFRSTDDMRALSERHTRYLIPYVAVFGAVWLLVGFSGPDKPGELIIAAALQVGVAALAWAWSGANSTPRFMLGTAALGASLALLRDASAANPAVVALLVLPTLLAATRANRIELTFSLVVSAVVLYLPELIIGGPEYPGAALRSETVTLLVALVIGATVLRLVNRLLAGEEHARQLAEEAQRQLATEDALRRVATIVAAGAQPAELFSEVSQQLAEVAGASIGAVVRFEPDDVVGEMVGGWQAGRGAVLSGLRIDLTGPTASARVFRSGRSVTLAHYPSKSGMEGVFAAVASPIVVRGRLWGAASAAFGAGETIPDGIQGRFERFADLVAMAIANADSVSELVEHATLDALTGIPNRRSFDQQLLREIERAERRGQPLALALIDVDHFKSVNDTHGHPVGDWVLARIAERLSREARTGEMVARLGGEEFVWLMPDTTAEEAFVAAERARRAVAAIDLGPVGHVTLSAGVNSNLESRTGLALLAGADEALYAAKSRGRDQTVAAPAALSASSAEERVNPAAA